MRRRQWSLASLLLGSATLLAACGGDGAAPTPTIGPTPTATAPAATETAVPDPLIGRVVWTTSVDPATNAPLAPVEEFAADASVIFGVVRVEHLPAQAVVAGAWTYNGAPIQGVSRSVVPSREYRAGYIAFHLTRGGDALWPTGSYNLTVSLGGQVLQSADVSVTDA